MTVLMIRKQRTSFCCRSFPGLRVTEVLWGRTRQVHESRQEPTEYTVQFGG